MPLLIDNDSSSRVLEMDTAIRAIEAAFTQYGRDEATFQGRTDIICPPTEGADYYCGGSMLGTICYSPRLVLRFKSDMFRWNQADDETITEEKYKGSPGNYMEFVKLFVMSDGGLLGLLNICNTCM